MLLTGVNVDICVTVPQAAARISDLADLRPQSLLERYATHVNMPGPVLNACRELLAVRSIDCVPCNCQDECFQLHALHLTPSH